MNRSSHQRTLTTGSTMRFDRHRRGEKTDVRTEDGTSADGDGTSVHDGTVDPDLDFGLDVDVVTVITIEGSFDDDLVQRLVIIVVLTPSVVTTIRRRRR